MAKGVDYSNIDFIHELGMALNGRKLLGYKNFKEFAEDTLKVMDLGYEYSTLGTQKKALLKQVYEAVTFTK